MFTGFTDETLRYFLDLRFNNNTSFFHETHDRYIETVQKLFYELIETLSPMMRRIDPLMEIRPSKCLSHIHRDTRFSKDKSPYRDHLWFLFRRAAEPREKSLNFFFEFGPETLGWGMGFWGENREVLDIFRKKILADPADIRKILPAESAGGLILEGRFHKRMAVPDGVPEDLKRWYLIKEMYICRDHPVFSGAFTSGLVSDISHDFLALAPLYQTLRGIYDSVLDEMR